MPLIILSPNDSVSLFPPSPAIRFSAWLVDCIRCFRSSKFRIPSSSFPLATFCKTFRAPASAPSALSRHSSPATRHSSDLHLLHFLHLAFTFHTSDFRTGTTRGTAWDGSWDG